MPLLAHPAQVRPYFGYRNANRIRLTARALRMGELGWEHGGTARKLIAMLRQFASSEVPGLDVSLEVSGRDGGRHFFRSVSDADGYVHFDVAAPAGTSPPGTTDWERVRLHWINREGPQSTDAFVLAPVEGAALGIVSDIDDTIIETGAGDLTRNWRRVLAQMPGERLAVPGAAGFYARLSASGQVGDTEPAGRRPFFYVSSSPWNLFDYLVAFQKLHRLPQGPILLRDWDLSRATFGSSAHRSHKAGAIDALIDFYPQLRFALIGDNTQADAMAYAEVVARHPRRIAAVFLRMAPGADTGGEEEAACAAIRAAGVPLWTGASYDTGTDFLTAMGFTPGGETTQIVRTIEGAPGAGEPPAGTPVDLPMTPA
ncbi:phosphatase domain-containing protein [Qipengyuania sediminis]|uniref:phosphatase domain-containing protein n=1 Tax=Qipengyuania sediminis TaxID=1532023 RepID=UPI00105A0AA5|nr:phosphatase domain-containing protein [Qipengyuania sediminis]